MRDSLFFDTPYRQQPLSGRNPAIDHPVEGTARQNLVAAFRHVACDMEEFRRLPGPTLFVKARGLPGGKVRQRAGTNAQFDQV
jgi:hypothetical protein